jgi:tRNA G46 methylase TrmB
MPKINANIFNKYVKQCGEDTFATDSTMLYCKICEVKVSANKKFTVTQHIKTNKHERLLARRNKPAENKQQTNSRQTKNLFFQMIYARL